VHRVLMRLYAQAGRREAAARQYEGCVGVLRSELGVEPESDTHRLYERIVAAPGVAPATGPRFRLETEAASIEAPDPARLVEPAASARDTARRVPVRPFALPTMAEQQAAQRAATAAKQMARDLRHQIAQGRSLLRGAVRETREAVVGFKKLL